MDYKLVKELMLKDLQETRKNGFVFYTILIMPLIFSIMGVIVVATTTLTGSISSTQGLPSEIAILPNLFSGIIVMIPGVITSLIGSTSIVIEKNNHSLEPLLGTPITDSELFLGKSLAPFIPAMGATYLSYAIYIGGSAAVTLPHLGYLVIPNTVTYIEIFFLSPVVGFLGTFAALLVSSKVRDVRAAQQVSGFVVLPVMVLIFVPLISSSYNVLILLLFGAVLLVAVIALYFLTVKAFNRESILVNWK